MRHAKASKLTVGTADIERGLHSKGKKNASLIGKRLNLLGDIPDLIISSPANRAVETAHILAHEFNYPLQNLMLEPSLYGSSSKEAVEMLKKQSGVKSILILGHNPLFEELAGFLCKSAPKKIPTCGVVCFQFKQEEWSKIVKGQSKLIFADSPQNKDRENNLMKSVRKVLAKNVVEKINDGLKDVDDSALKSAEKSVAKAARKVVKDFVNHLPFEKIAELMPPAEKKPETSKATATKTQKAAPKTVTKAAPKPATQSTAKSAPKRTTKETNSKSTEKPQSKPAANKSAQPAPNTKPKVNVVTSKPGTTLEPAK